MSDGIRKIGFFTAFIIPALVVIGFYVGGWGNYLAIIFSFILMPLIDQWSGTDTTNVSDSDVKLRSEEFFYRLVTYLWTYCQLAFIIWAAWLVSTGQLTNIIDWIGFVISCALVTGGIGITVAHELGHKKSFVEKFYSKVLLMTVCYMHFYIEHNRGHHVLVATPGDPATARKHQNFYSFWIQSAIGGYFHAWKIERERLERNDHAFISIHNEMIRFFFLPLIFCGSLLLLGSYWKGSLAWEVTVFFFLQSFLALTLLELVNYVEHYGIMRQEISPGKFERVNPLHSWNASHLISNFFLFQLQRHSDHHAFAHKRYQVLNHYDESPQLPFGYPTMIMIALFPPLWFGLMNKRLEQWQKQKISPGI